MNSGSDRVSVDRRHFLQSTVGLGIAATAPGRVRGEDVDATEIEDWHDLDAIREDLSGRYRLVADLDETTAGYDEHVSSPAQGWQPLGDEDEFTGAFDGNGYEIADLVVERPETDHIGLFARNSGHIESVRLDDCAIMGEKQGWQSRRAE